MPVILALLIVVGMFAAGDATQILAQDATPVADEADDVQEIPTAVDPEPPPVAPPEEVPTPEDPPPEALETATIEPESDHESALDPADSSPGEPPPQFDATSQPNLDSPEIEPPPPVPDTLSCLPESEITAYLNATVTYLCALSAGSDRTSTTIHAELTAGATDGWLIYIEVVNPDGSLDASATGSAADAHLATGLEQGGVSSFRVGLLSPSQITSPLTATATVSAVAEGSGDSPSQTGVAYAELVASGMPLPPEDSEPNQLACDMSSASTVATGEATQLACSYTVLSESGGARLIAEVATASVPGWEVEIGPSDGSELPWSGRSTSTAWDGAVSSPHQTVVEIVVRVHAPDDAALGEQATITIHEDQDGSTTANSPAPVSWTLSIVEPPSAEAIVSQSAADGFLPCQSTLPAGPGPVPGGVIAFTCNWVNTNETQGHVNVSAQLDTHDQTSPDWQLEVSLIPPHGDLGFRTGTSVEFNDVPAQGEDVGITISVNISLVAKPGDSATLTVRVTCQSGTSSSDCENRSTAFDVYASEIAAEVDWVRMRCFSLTNFAIDGHGAASFSCTMQQMVYVPGGARLHRFSVTVPSADWEMSLSGLDSYKPTVTRQGNTIHFRFTDLVLFSPATFSLSLTTPCNVAQGSYPVEFSTRISGGTNDTTDGPAAGFTLSSPGYTPGAPVGVRFSSPEIPVGFIDADTGGHAETTALLFVDPPNCLEAGVTRALTLSIQGDDQWFFPPEGPGNLGLIPLGYLMLAKVSLAIGEGTGITIHSPGVPTTLMDGFRIATVDGPAGADSVLGLRLTAELDGDEPARLGTHTATLTVTVSEGEDP